LVFLLVFEVYRLAHKSFVACSQLLLVLLSCQLLDLQLIAVLCCLTLKQLTVSSVFPVFLFFFFALIEMENCIQRAAVRGRGSASN